MLQLIFKQKNGYRQKWIIVSAFLLPTGGELAQFGEIPFCTSTPVIYVRGPDGRLACKSHEMLYLMKVRGTNNTWYMICHYEKSVRSMVCPVWKHEFNGYVCYESIRCP